MKRKLENGAHGRETPAEIKAGRAQHARGLPDLPRVRADSERIEPFVDIATLFSEKCHHWAFPRHIAKQALLRSKSHHRTSARSAWGLRGRMAMTTHSCKPHEIVPRALREYLRWDSRHDEMAAK